MASPPFIAAAASINGGRAFEPCFGGAPRIGRTAHAAASNHLYRDVSQGRWLRMRRYLSRTILALGVTAALSVPAPSPLNAQASGGPTILHPLLDVRPVVEGLSVPTSIAFVGPDEMFVLEKNSGRVLHVEDGEAPDEVLDLSVNSNSERGLLGISLHPDFPDDPGVYLFWSCRSAAPLDDDPFTPEEEECSDDPGVMTGLVDSGNVFQVPLLGNRVDRFEWTGSELVYDHNLIKLLAFQNDGAPVPEGQDDAAQPPRGNHDGGVIAFGPDDKLYVMFGDVGRRGQLQNLPAGPGPGDDDDQFGGPEPDEAHLRLRDPEQLRHGVRPVLGQAVGPGERRGRLRRVEPGRAGHELGMDPDHRTRRASVRLQGDRDDGSPSRGLPEPPAVPVGTGADRRLARGVTVEAVRAPWLDVQRSRVQLEARGPARRDRVRRVSGAWATVRRRPVRRAGPSDGPRERIPVPVQPHRESAEDRGR